ncbi:hypothetical protein GLOIN_2v1883504 [Rhizophagus irregularis DAOM 181602=DAOM 197198]|nr:hypothetical protein GLOIN_2v1883504 [Rhizophagus irregularis DAOM 181602=DAOM 197198]
MVHTSIPIADSDLSKLSDGTNNENLRKIFDYDNNKNEIINEINENTSKYYIPKFIPVIITLGIFQFIFIVFCILLMIGSWEWFGERKPKLKKSTYIIYRLERILLLITTSFLGIWILISEISEIFQRELTVTYYYKKDSFENTIEIFYNIFGIITIIPISIVFVAIRKRSKSLYALFYFASLIEALIILCRLLFSFHKEYISYCRIFRLHNFYPYDGKGYYPNVKLNIDNNITYRVRFFIDHDTKLLAIR